MTDKKMCDCNQGRLPCTCKPQTDGVLAWAELKDGELVAKEGFVVTCTGVGQYTVQTVEQAQGLSNQPHGEPVALPERDVLRDIVAQAIGGDTYDCTRVWSAWGVGTMSEDDFVPVVEQDERLYEIADACLDEIAKLGPLYTRPVQGEPYAWHVESPATPEHVEGIAHTKEQADKYLAMGWSVTPVFRHADPAEVEQGYSHEVVQRLQAKNDDLRAQVAERDALLRKALADIEYIQKECGGDASPGYLGCLVDDVVELLSASAEPEVKS